MLRPILSDEEFVARLDADGEADPEVVGEIRALAARCFRRVGGEHFHPEDRLDEDLHLRDLAPFATESFCAGLEQAFGLGEDALRSRIAPGGITTFGQLVLAAAVLVADARERPRAEDG
jgi:hypothetical protein